MEGRGTTQRSRVTEGVGYVSKAGLFGGLCHLLGKITQILNSFGFSFDPWECCCVSGLWFTSGFQSHLPATVPVAGQ